MAEPYVVTAEFPVFAAVMRPLELGGAVWPVVKVVRRHHQRYTLVRYVAFLDNQYIHEFIFLCRYVSWLGEGTGWGGVLKAIDERDLYILNKDDEFVDGNLYLHGRPVSVTDERTPGKTTLGILIDPESPTARWGDPGNLRLMENKIMYHDGIVIAGTTMCSSNDCVTFRKLCLYHGWYIKVCIDLCLIDV